MNILNIAADITSSIKKQNLDAEVIVRRTNKISVSRRLLKIEEISQAKNCVIGIRAIANKNRVAYISTNDLGSISDTIKMVIEMSRNAPEDPYINFSQSYDTIPSVDLGILDSNVITIDNLKSITEATESAALAHENIINSEGSSSSYTLIDTALSTASDFISSYSQSIFTNHVSVVAGNKDNMKVGYDYDITCDFSNLKSPESIGKRAAQRAISQLNSRTIKTGKFPVVFEARVAAELVKSLASAINGQNIVNNSSFLQNSLNTKIFNNKVEIIDDPLLFKGIASRPFDGEGLASKRNVFVRNGILQNWILDLYSAKRLSLQTTHNAVRGNDCSIMPQASNFYIKNGNSSFEELIREVKEGIYVTDLFGFGTNLVNGDYSQGASGFFIENGQITYPVHEITIADNLSNMLSNLVVANDLHFCGQFNSPTIKIPQMTVAGRISST